MTVRNTRGIGYVRYVLLDDSMVVLAVEVPHRQRNWISDKTIKSFLESLRVSRP